MDKYKKSNQQYRGNDNSPKVDIDKIKALLDIERSTSQVIVSAIEQIENLVQDRKPVKSHQIRNIFILLKETGNDVKELNLIRPRLAYIGARQTIEHGKEIVRVINELIKTVTEESDFEKQTRMLKGLGYIMECIVAYHKFYVRE